jgi:hypothetical protein
MLMQEERELVVEYGKDERRPVEHRNQRQYQYLQR